MLETLGKTQNQMAVNQKMMVALISANKKKIKDLEERVAALEKKVNDHGNDWK